MIVYKTKRFLLYMSLLVALVLLLLTFLPMFIDLNKYKDVLSKEIEKKTGVFVKINGDVRVSYLPSLRVVMNDVDLSVTDKENAKSLNKLGSAEKIYMELSLSSFMNKDFSQVKKTVVFKPQIKISKENQSARGSLLDIMGGTNLNIEDLFFSDGYVEYPNFEENESLILEKVYLKVGKKDKITRLSGTFKLNGMDLNTDSIFDINNSKYFTGRVRVFSKERGDEKDLKFNISNKNDSHSFVGSFYIDSRASREFISNIKKLLPEGFIRGLKLMDLDEDVRATVPFKYGDKLISLENVDLKSKNNRVKISLYYDLDKKTLDFNSNSNNFLIGSNFYNRFYSRTFIVQNPDESFLDMFKSLLSLNDFNIVFRTDKADFRGEQFKNVYLKLNKYGLKGVRIENFSAENFFYKKLKFDGKINSIYDDSFLNGNLEVYFNKKTKFEKKAFNDLKLDKLKANLNVFSRTNIIVSNFDLETSAGKILGSAKYFTDKGNKIFETDFNTNYLDLNKLFKSSLFELFSEAKILGVDEFTLKGQAKEAVFKDKRYNDIELDINLLRDLKIKKLIANIGNYSFALSGDILNVNKKSETAFKDFKYSIKLNSIEKENKTSFLDNNLLNMILNQNIGTVDILLDGNIKNPSKVIDANLENADMKVFRKGDVFNVSIKTKDMKSILSNVFDNSFLVNEYLRDNIVADISFDANSNFDFLKNFSLKSGKSNISGDIYIKPYVTFNLKSPFIDTLQFLKQSSDGYRHNAALNILNSFNGSAKVNVEKIGFFGKQEFSDFVLDLNKISGPEDYIKLETKSQDSSVKLDAKIFNNSVYKGNLVYSGDVKSSLLGDKGFDILNAEKVFLNMDFSTSGTRVEEVAANLDSNFKISFDKGRVQGVSSKRYVADTIALQENLTSFEAEEIMLKSVPLSSIAFDKIDIDGHISLGEVEEDKTSIKIFAGDVLLNGSFGFNLKNKLLSITADLDFKNLFNKNILLKYIALGYVGDIKAEAVLKEEANFNLTNIKSYRYNRDSLGM